MSKRGDERSDEALAMAALAGSGDAFRELVERFEGPVFGLLVRIVRRAELAEELAQETFVKAWRALDRFDPARKFSSWLFKIAHNAALDELSRQGGEMLSLDAPVGLLPVTIAPPGVPTPAAARSAGAPVEIELAGAVVRVRAEVAPATLRMVLEALRGMTP